MYSVEPEIVLSTRYLILCAPTVGVFNVSAPHSDWSVFGSRYHFFGSRILLVENLRSPLLTNWHCTVLRDCDRTALSFFFLQCVLRLQLHSEHRFPAPSSELCQNWLRQWRGTLYLRAAVHRRCQRPSKGLGGRPLLNTRSFDRTSKPLDPKFNVFVISHYTIIVFPYSYLRYLSSVAGRSLLRPACGQGRTVSFI